MVWWRLFANTPFVIHCNKYMRKNEKNLGERKKNEKRGVQNKDTTPLPSPLPRKKKNKLNNISPRGFALLYSPPPPPSFPAPTFFFMKKAFPYTSLYTFRPHSKKSPTTTHNNNMNFHIYFKCVPNNLDLVSSFILRAETVPHPPSLY